MPKRNNLKAFIQINQKLSLILSKKQSLHLFQKPLKQLLYLQPKNPHLLYLYSKALRDKKQSSSSSLQCKQRLQLQSQCPFLSLSIKCMQAAVENNPCFYISMSNNEESIIKWLEQTSAQINKYVKEGNLLEKKWYQILTMYSKKKDLYTCQVVLKLFEGYKEKKEECSPQQLSTLGLISYEAGDYPSSAQYYKSAISTKPSEYKYYNNLAILYCILEKYSQSLQLVQKSLELNPGYAKSSFILSFSLSALGRNEEALAKVVSAVENNSKSTMFRLKLIIILLSYYSQQGSEIQKNVKQINDIITNSKDTDSYFFIKQNIPALKSFVQFVESNYKEAETFGDKWKRYLQCMNEFLLKGHYHKYVLGVEMKQLQNQMIKIKEKIAQQSVKAELNLAKLDTQVSQKIEIPEQKNTQEEAVQSI